MDKVNDPKVFRRVDFAKCAGNLPNQDKVIFIAYDRFKCRKRFNAAKISWNLRCDHDVFPNGMTKRVYPLNFIRELRIIMEIIATYTATSLGIGYFPPTMWAEKGRWHGFAIRSWIPASIL